ncbi:MAG: hypothetical protein P1U84_03340 [Parvibaculaceae bacterium]|nr:hypothetical protein [Parvibaculaceae bacterium]
MSSAPTVTIVTDRAHIPLSAGDQAYADAMESMGCHVVPVSWNDPAWRQTGAPPPAMSLCSDHPGTFGNSPAAIWNSCLYWII